jgi:DNA-binding NtrC family response regulator
MNKRLILLLTRDFVFEGELRKAFGDEAKILVKRGIGNALQVVCARRKDLDLAVIDFDDGCHGMTLLNAIRMIDERLPVVGVTSDDTYHAAAVAYANGAAACVAKPITAAELRLVIEDLANTKPKLMAA